MALKDYIIIDKTQRKPTIVEQVVSQVSDLIENGQLPEELRILPSYDIFAKEFTITRMNSSRIYERLKKYGGYDKYGNLYLDSKAYAMYRLKESVEYALNQGISSAVIKKSVGGFVAEYNH